MKKTILASAIVAVGLIALAPAAYAVDGTITINGSITSTTCTINGGSPNVAVTLPKVSTASLGVGQVSGRTPFWIQLTNCKLDDGVTKVTPYFEPGPTINVSSGRLTNQDKGAGAATNVEIGILNNGYGRVQLGGTQATQSSTSAVFANSAATLKYFAQYEQSGTAAATAGTVNSSVQYTLIYE